MSGTQASTEDHYQPGGYEIRIKGHLDDRRAGWFEGLTITLEEDGTMPLTGPVADQAALHSLLRKVRDLSVPLLSVNRVAPGPSTALGTGQAGATSVASDVKQQIAVSCLGKTAIFGKEVSLCSILGLLQPPGTGWRPQFCQA
jgi:hypothetical protein